MDITLDWLLHESSLNDLKIVSCPDNIHTPITGVNIMDNPDTVQWLKPGELILTTGYIFMDDTLLQHRILEELKQAGCCALCLKTQRFFDAFPESMLQKANEIGLVCIELPYYYSLSDISDEITRKLYSIQFEKAASEQIFLNALFNAFFQGKSMNEILQLVSDYLQCSVLILDEQNQIPWYHFAKTDFPDFPAVTDLQTLVPDHFRMDKQTHKKSYTAGKISLLGKTKTVSLMPLSNPRYNLCLWHADPDALPWNTISHILQIIDFSRTGTRLRRTNVSNYYDSFFHYLLEPETFSETSAIQLFEYYGIPHSPQAICIVLSCRDKKQEFSADALLSPLKKALSAGRRQTPAFFIGYNKNQLCLCIFEQDPPALESVLDFIQNSVDMHHSNLVAGISRPVLKNLAEAYKEASFMLSLSRFFPEERIFLFQDYMLYWTISQMPEEEKQSLYRITIEPLVAYDQKANANLTETLQMYFRCHLNSSLAATKLYIHRNTFLKRMEKIQSLINFDPEDHNNMFSFFYGLCIYQTLSES